LPVPPGVTGLDAGTAVEDGAGERSLEGVVGGVGGIGNDGLETEATGDDAAGVEGGEGGRAGVSAWIGVGIGHARQAEGGGADIGGVGGEAAEGAFEAEAPGLEECVVEAGIDGAETEQRELMTGGKGGQVLLIAVDVHDGVGGDFFRIAGGEDVRALRGVGGRQLIGSDLKTVSDLAAL